MDDLATAAPIRSAMRPDLAPRLCQIVEGVEFWVRLPHEQHLHCVITEPALRGHFGADADHPDSWLDVFARHRAAIETFALAASARRSDVHVVLVSDPSGRLTASVGRCGLRGPSRIRRQPDTFSSASQPCDNA